MKKYIINAVLFFFIPLFSLQAQTVRASVDSSTAYIGQSIQYSIQISGSEKTERPVLTGFNAFKVEDAGQSTSMRSSFLNGSGSREVVSIFSWKLTPLKTGKLTIPSVKVSIDGKDISTRSGTLEVKDPGPLDGYHLILSSEESDVFPGLPVRVTLKWLFSSQVSTPEFTLPFLDNPDLQIENIPAPSRQSNDIFKFTIKGETVYAVQSAEIYKGEQYVSLTMAWDCYPGQTDSIGIQPVLLAFKRAIGRDSWGNYKYENAVIPSNALTLKVRPVPGELADSPGGILLADGALSPETSLDQERVYPGDPVTVELILSGLVNPEWTRFPGFSGFPELTRDFVADTSSIKTRIEDGKLIISQVVRPKNADISQFPGLKLLYYDREAGEVKSVSTPALSLDVIPSAGGIASVPDHRSLINSSVISGEKDDLIGIKHNMDIQNIHDSFLFRIPLWILLLIPFMSFVLIKFIYQLRRYRSGSLFQRLFKKKDGTILLKKRIKSISNSPAIEDYREFYAYLKEWYYREYPDLFEGKEFVTSESIQKSFPGEKTATTVNTVTELERICWSGEEIPVENFFRKYSLENFIPREDRKTS